MTTHTFKGPLAKSAFLYPFPDLSLLYIEGLILSLPPKEASLNTDAHAY